MPIIKKYFISYFITILIWGCVKEDLSKISDDFIWEPTFSFPISELDLGTDDYNGSQGFLGYYNTNQEVLISEYTKFSFNDITNNAEEVKELMFRFNIENNFPANLEVYGYYIDQFGNIIKSILQDPPLDINAAETNDDGNVIKSNSIIHDISLHAEDDELINSVRQILLIIYFKELDESPNVIQQIDNYNVDVSVGVRAALEVPLIQ